MCRPRAANGRKERRIRIPPSPSGPPSRSDTRSNETRTARSSALKRERAEAGLRLAGGPRDVPRQYPRRGFEHQRLRSLATFRRRWKPAEQVSPRNEVARLLRTTLRVPRVRVVAIPSVVTKHEVLAVGHYLRRVGVIRRAQRIRLDDRGTIDDDVACADSYRFTRQTNDALHEVARGIKRKQKHE